MPIRRGLKRACFNSPVLRVRRLSCPRADTSNAQPSGIPPFLKAMYRLGTLSWDGTRIRLHGKNRCRLHQSRHFIYSDEWPVTYVSFNQIRGCEHSRLKVGIIGVRRGTPQGSHCLRVAGGRGEGGRYDDALDFVRRFRVLLRAETVRRESRRLGAIR